MSHTLNLLPLTLLALLPACRGPEPAARPQSAPAALTAGATEDLGRHSFPITTRVAVAQRWFDQGLLWCYAFHHAEATRAFTAAAAADPGCAMAYWGLAYAAGPHINNMEMSEDSARAAHENARKATGLAAGTTPLEQALIRAIGVRYAWPAPADRKQLDQAYADAMREAYRAHGQHPDVGALFTEALMDLRPWDLWQKDGSPQPETPEIVATLEALLASHPEHPQANHLYIHAVEASLDPGRALPAAMRLGSLVPASGHLVHMPSHTFIRTGRYEQAAAANRAAIQVDHRIVARTGRVGFYELYRAHNHHFLVYAAMFEGRADEAIATARALVQELGVEVVQAMPDVLEGFLGAPYHALVRFGRWQEILAAPEPPAWQAVTLAMHHYARGVALAATGGGSGSGAWLEAATAEREAFARALAAVPATRYIGNNKAADVLQIGRAILDGEIEFRRGRREAAFTALAEAVRRDDELRYDEPWGWMMPARHPLGALLLEAGQLALAEAVYRLDLARHPDNGWALHGLAECLRRRGATAEAQAVADRFTRAWARAQVEIGGSCFCRRNAPG